MLKHRQPKEPNEQDRTKQIIDNRIKSAYSGTPDKLANFQGMKSKHKRQRVTLRWRELPGRTQGTILGFLTGMGIWMVLTVFITDTPIRIAIGLIVLMICIIWGYILGRTTEQEPL